MWPDKDDTPIHFSMATILSVVQSSLELCWSKQTLLSISAKNLADYHPCFIGLPELMHIYQGK